MMETELPPGSSNSTGHLSTIGWQVPGRMHHSASTPAGVDGGGSRTPPATPKKGGKMLAVRVQMLDDSISMFQIQSKALGRVLFDQVCRQLHLLEADYFGLEYQDANGSKDWLDVEKPMCRQLGLSMLEPTLRFCVKFYTPDPARLEEEFTRYLFCLQVKRDLAQGSIQCNENTAALMASYIVQGPSSLRAREAVHLQDADLEVSRGAEGRVVECRAAIGLAVSDVFIHPYSLTVSGIGNYSYQFTNNKYLEISNN